MKANSGPGGAVYVMILSSLWGIAPCALEEVEQASVWAWQPNTISALQGDARFVCFHFAWLVAGPACKVGRGHPVENIRNPQDFRTAKALKQVPMSHIAGI